MDFIKVKQVDSTTFTGSNLWQPYPGACTFGGQLVGQSLFSIFLSCSDKIHPHSMHVYFHSGAVIEKEIKYSVSSLKEGKTISSKRIEAYNDELLLFTAEVIYSQPRECLDVYESPSLKIVPDEYTPVQKVFKQKFLNAKICDLFENIYKPILENFNIYFGKLNGLKRQYKFEMKKALESREERLSVIAFISDFYMLEPATNEGIIKKVLSIDHKLYFHSDKFQMIYFTVECVRIHDAKVLSIGHLTNENGSLLATAIQEGLVIKERK